MEMNKKASIEIWKYVFISFQTLATCSFRADICLSSTLGLLHLLLGALGSHWVCFIRILHLGSKGRGQERQRVALEGFGGDEAVVELLEDVIALVERVDLALEDVELFLLFLKHGVKVLADVHSGRGAKWHAVEELGRAVGGVPLGCSNDGLGIGTQCQIELAALVQGHAAEEVGDGVVVESFLVPIILLCFGRNRLHRCIEGCKQLRERGFFFSSPKRLSSVLSAARGITQVLIGCADSLR
jgi:hypothetical protein